MVGGQLRARRGLEVDIAGQSLRIIAERREIGNRRPIVAQPRELPNGALIDLAEGGAGGSSHSGLCHLDIGCCGRQASLCCIIAYDRMLPQHIPAIGLLRTDRVVGCARGVVRAAPGAGREELGRDSQRAARTRINAGSGCPIAIDAGHLVAKGIIAVISTHDFWVVEGYGDAIDFLDIEGVLLCQTSLEIRRHAMHRGGTC